MPLGSSHEYSSLLYNTYKEVTLKANSWHSLWSEPSYNFDFQDDRACGLTVLTVRLLELKNEELGNVISFIYCMAKTDTVIFERWCYLNFMWSPLCIYIPDNKWLIRKLSPSCRNLCVAACIISHISSWCPHIMTLWGPVVIVQQHIMMLWGPIVIVQQHIMTL